MKTVLFTISNLKHKGPTLVLLAIIKNLDRSRFEPLVVTLSKETKHSLLPEFEKYSPVCCLHTNGISSFIVGTYKLRKLVREIHPDIIHAHSFRDIILTGFFIPKMYKKCATLHNDWKTDYCLKYGKYIGGSSAWLQTQALKWIPQRIACSGMLADLLNKKYPAMHFESVNNCVDTDKFHPVADKDALRRQLGLPLDKKIVVWAGSFIPRKDPLTMARAILQLSDEPYYFVFCGTGPLEQACKELLKERHNVLFTGFITNIEKYYQAADIYVATSKSEGLPLAVLEAQFCGLVPLLSDIPQHRYILSQKQEQKCLFENNVQDLIIHLKALLNADNTALLQIGTEHVQQFAALQMTRHYMEFYL